jgi:hypothetical protein
MPTAARRGDTGVRGAQPVRERQAYYFSQGHRAEFVGFGTQPLRQHVVFGVPLIDEVYRLRVRCAASHARQAVHEHASLVPDVTEENLFVSNEIPRNLASTTAPMGLVI